MGVDVNSDPRGLAGAAHLPSACQDSISRRWLHFLFLFLGCKVLVSEGTAW